MMSIGSRTSVTILDGNGRLTGIVDVRPKGKPMVNGRISNSMRLRPNLFGQPGTAGEEELGFLSPDRHRGHDRHAGFNGASDVTLAAVEVHNVLGERGAKRVVVPAGKHQQDSSGVQHLRSVLPARRVSHPRGAATPRAV